MTQESTPPLEPLPCPFCGSDPMPDFCSTNDGPAYSFHCQSKDCPAWPNAQGETEAEAIAAWNRRTPPAGQSDFQTRVDAWMDACFGNTIKSDKLERADRFCEEALELCQTMSGFSKDRAHALVDYVFGRPEGETFQEVGGVMITLAALCNTVDLNIDEAQETELARVWTKVEQIRAKQAAKPTGSALPITPNASQSDDALAVQLRNILDMFGANEFRARALVPIMNAREASARAEGKREGIEEAAKVFDHGERRTCTGHDIAAAIRALAEKQP